MSAGKVFAFLAFAGVFGGFHYLLNHDRRTFSGSAEDDRRVIQEMAVFIQKHPEMVLNNRNVSEPGAERRSVRSSEADVPAPLMTDPEVLGIALNRQTLEKLSTPEGLAEIQVRIGQNPLAFQNEIKQAWKILDPSDLERREALQELTMAFRQVRTDPELETSLVDEFKRVHGSPELTDDRLEYAGRTLQRHLNSEKDSERLTEQLQALGIPRVVVENPVPGRSPASEDPSK